MSKLNNATKLIFANLTIFLLLLFCPAIIFRIWSVASSRLNKLSSLSDPRSSYPTYTDKTVSAEILSEFSRLPAEYKSFVAWKRLPVNYKHTNIHGPYNTRSSLGQNLNSSTWFFGGSTMWGTGTSDSQTIPSNYHLIARKPVYNFGETGWTSRQSLNQFLNLVADENNPSAIVFYDGVNDVAFQCRTEIKSLPSHEQESLIQSSLNSRSFKSNLTHFLIAPYKSLYTMLNHPATPDIYDCSSNHVKSRAIAKHLVSNWYYAYLISKSKGYEFLAILQPTLFSSNTNWSYFSPDEKRRLALLKPQFDSVYPLIISEMQTSCKTDPEFCAKLVDGSSWLHGYSNIFIDFCHLNHKGNEIIAKNIAREFKLPTN